MSGNVSAVSGAGSAMVSAGADAGAGMGFMVVGTSAGVDAAAVVEVQVGMIARSVVSVCAVVSEHLAPAGVQHITAEVVEANVEVEAEIYEQFCLHVWW